MQHPLAIAMPGPVEILLLLGFAIVALAVLFSVVYVAAKLGRDKTGEYQPPARE